VPANSAPPTTLANSHAELRTLWSKKERRRADGGWWSLSGFSIQATIALDRFVRRAVIDGAPDAYAFEAVSDFSVTSDKVSLTQVKRTLTRTTLAAAVGEARTILDLCSPAFAEKVEFQIICERDEEGLKLSDLTPSEVFNDFAATPAELSRVLARFNPATPVKVMAHPGLSLRRTLLSAGVRDPDRVARDALGTLFDAFDGRDREGIERALMRALSDIRASARTEDMVPGRLLAPDMFKRRAARSTSIFVGARPRLSDLVAKQFLDRRDALEPLVEAAEVWLSSLDQSYADDDLRLPVLWLEGRPGDGKSVLTLQLLEHLIVTAARLSSVTELATTGELSAWMTSAARRDTGYQAEIGFIDDLGSYIDQAGLEALIDKAFYRGSPYVGLITCGTAKDGASFAGGRRVAVRGQRLGESLHPSLRGSGRYHRAVPRLQVRHLPAGELGDRAGTGDLGDEAEGVGGEIVVGVPESAAPDIGDGEQLGRAAPATAGWTPRRACLDHVVGQQVVQVAPDSRRGKAQACAQAGRGDRAVFHDQPGDPGPCAPF